MARDFQIDLDKIQRNTKKIVKEAAKNSTQKTKQRITLRRFLDLYFTQLKKILENTENSPTAVYNFLKYDCEIPLPSFQTFRIALWRCLKRHERQEVFPAEPIRKNINRDIGAKGGVHKNLSNISNVKNVQKSVQEISEVFLDDDVVSNHSKNVANNGRLHPRQREVEHFVSPQERIGSW